MESAGNYDPLSVARDAQTIQLLQVVPATLMVYDCMLSLEDEVKYIWKKRFSSISVVYLTFRYLGTVFILFSTAEIIVNENTTNRPSAITIISFTHDFLGLDIWFSFVTYWFVQIILVLRLYALYGGSKKVLIMTALALVVEAVVMTVCAALVTNSADEILLSLGSKISEFPNVALKIYINYSAMIACEWLLFMLAVVAAVRRHQAKLGPVPASWDGVRRLGDIIIQGNVLYFPVVLIYCIVYLVVSLTLPVEWLLGIFGLGVSIAIINGCHLILHVRSAVSQPPTPSPGYVLDEDGLEFALPPIASFYSNRNHAYC